MGESELVHGTSKPSTTPDAGETAASVARGFWSLEHCRGLEGGAGKREHGEAAAVLYG